MSPTLASRVVDQWNGEGVAMDGPAVSPSELDAIERVHGIRLPPSFRELWSRCDGTCTTDRHWLIFLQASDLAQPDHGSRDGERFLLTFADHRLGTAVCLALGPDSEDLGVWLVDTTQRRLSARFDAFLARILEPTALSADEAVPAGGPG